MTASKARIAVAGAGLIGKRHVEEIAASERCVLASIIDVSPGAADVARQYGVPLYRTLEECFAAGTPDGIVLATPNQLHLSQGLACIAAGVPVLVEKPIADTLVAG
jgi:predicted dehydrogenase